MGFISMKTLVHYSLTISYEKIKILYLTLEVLKVRLQDQNRQLLSINNNLSVLNG